MLGRKLGAGRQPIATLFRHGGKENWPVGIPKREVRAVLASGLKATVRTIVGGWMTKRGISIRTVRGASAFPETGDLDAFDMNFSLPLFEPIEDQIHKTQQLGKQPLWDGYSDLQRYGRDVGPNAERSVKQVRSTPELCRFYAWLVTQKRPQAVLEFGAAFGVSGMYWLAGLEANQSGHLYSFEPNEVWFDIACENFAAVSSRATFTNGTFEDGVKDVPRHVDIALIDAIHTRDFVVSQFALVKQVARPGALIIFDDINFSRDMRRCWQEVASDSDLAAVWELNGRVGMIELPS